MARNRKHIPVEPTETNPAEPVVAPSTTIDLDALERAVFAGDHEDRELFMQRHMFRIVRTCGGDDPVLIVSILVGTTWRYWLRGEYAALRAIAEYLDPNRPPEDLA